MSRPLIGSMLSTASSFALCPIRPRGRDAYSLNESHVEDVPPPWQTSSSQGSTALHGHIEDATTCSIVLLVSSPTRRRLTSKSTVPSQAPYTAWPLKVYRPQYFIVHRKLHQWMSAASSLDNARLSEELALLLRVVRDWKFKYKNPSVYFIGVRHNLLKQTNQINTG